MNLHQINVNYLPDDDRLLCRVSFHGADGGLQEVRAWITRRLMRNLWGGLMRALQTQVTLDKPQATSARAEIVGMEHASSVAQIRDEGNFSNPYESGKYTLPLGEVPILVSKVTFNLQTGKALRINLVPSEGHGLEFALTPQALHGFCSVLIDAVGRSGWDLVLNMPGSSTQAPSSVLN